MIECHHPFGITPEMVGDFDRKQDAIKVSNSPVRDVAKETFWDFAGAPYDDSPFEQDALQLLGREN
jgi:hypothetical protein